MKIKKWWNGSDMDGPLADCPHYHLHISVIKTTRGLPNSLNR